MPVILRRLATPLMHYDPSKTLILAYDASLYRVGVVLSHQVGECDLCLVFSSTRVEKLLINRQRGIIHSI